MPRLREINLRRNVTRCGEVSHGHTVLYSFSSVTVRPNFIFRRQRSRTLPRSEELSMRYVPYLWEYHNSHLCGVYQQALSVKRAGLYQGATCRIDWREAPQFRRDHRASDWPEKL